MQVRGVQGHGVRVVGSVYRDRRGGGVAGQSSHRFRTHPGHPGTLPRRPEQPQLSHDEVGADCGELAQAMLIAESGGEPSQAGVLGVTDPVLDWARDCLEERQLTGLGVSRHYWSRQPSASSNGDGRAGDAPIAGMGASRLAKPSAFASASF